VAFNTDHREKPKAASADAIELILSRVLLAGTLLAAVVIAIGGAAYLLRDGRQQPHYETFRGEPPKLESAAGILRDATQLDPQGIIALGILLLIATPVARVVAALMGFAWRKDAKYVLISSVVLAALVYGLLAG